MKKLYKKLGKRITAMALVLLMLASSGGASALAEVAEASASPAPASEPAPQAPDTPATPDETELYTADPTPEQQPTPEPAPTEAPTPAPTEAPTPEPTEAPTPAPTEAPTPAPTAAPTATPEPTATAAPTATPEPTATAAPTATPAPTATAAPTATPEPTSTPEPTPPPAANSALLSAGDGTAEPAAAQDLDLLGITLGADEGGSGVVFTIRDANGDGIIGEDESFTLNISYTLDNWALPKIDENTKIHWLFPEELELGATSGDLIDTSYTGVGVPGRFEVKKNDDDRWELVFQYNAPYLEVNKSDISGTFDFTCWVDDETFEDEDSVTIDFGGEDHTLPITLEKAKGTAQKTYDPRTITADGKVKFTITLDLNKKANNVQIVDTMGEAFKFDNPTDFTLTGPDGYSKIFTVSPAGNTATVPVGELAGGHYELTYTANVVATPSAAEAARQNRADITWEGGSTTGNTTVTWSDSANRLLKTASDVKEDDTGKKYVEWSIRLNDAMPRTDLKGMTLSDAMTKPEGSTVALADSVLIERSATGAEGTWQRVAAIDQLTDDGFSYTFDSDVSDTNIYRVTYRTNIDDAALADGSYTLRNTVKLLLDGKEQLADDAEATWTVGRNTTVTLQGVKKLETHGKQFPGQNFVFTLSKVDENGNRKQVDEQWVWFGAADSRKKIPFKALTFTQQDYINQPAGGYEFVVTEKNLANDPSQSSQHKPGTSYDRTEYHFFVKLTQNGKTGKLTAKVCDQNGKELPQGQSMFTFENEYDKAEVSLPVKKNLTGDPLPAGHANDTYQFVLTPKENGAHDLNSNAITDPNTEKTVSVGADQSGSLTGLVYYEEGDYTYTLTEAAPQNPVPGMTYDKTQYDVTVKVRKDQSGALVATVTEPPQGKESFEFTNTYQSTTIQFEGSKTIRGGTLKDNAKYLQFQIIETDKDGTELTDGYKSGNITIDSNALADDATIGAIPYPEITITEGGRHYYYKVVEIAINGATMVNNTGGYWVRVWVSEDLETITYSYKMLGATGTPEGEFQEGKPELNFENAFQSSVGPGKVEGTKYVNGQKYNTTSGYLTYGYWLIRQNWDETNGWTADWNHAHGTWSASDNGEFIIQLDKLHNGASFAFTGDDIGETYFYRLYEEDRSNSDPNTKFDTTEYWFAATITANADNTLNVSWQQIQKPKNPNSQLVADNSEIRFDNTYYAPAQFTIEGAKEVTHVFSDAGKPAPSSFKIKIQEVDATGADVPNSSLNQTLTPDPQTGKWSYSYKSITYRDNAGKNYYFRISEEIPGTNKEITYDTNVYYICVSVTLDEKNHKVVATPTAGTFENGAFVEDSRKPVKNFTFENKYTHREVTGNLALSGEKTIHTTQGEYEMQNDDFYVALFSEDGERLTNKVGIDADGSFSISADDLTTANKDALTFTAAGTYTFYVREMTHADDSMVSDIGGFTYDTTRYKVVYTVKEDNDKKGGLACSAPAITKQTWNAETEQYEDAGTADKAGLDFVNDYDETKIPPEVSITKDGAATSYKDGTASWTVTLKVENLKQGQMIENFIFTDEMTTFKPAGIGAETTIQGVQVAATTGKLVSYDEPDVKGNKVTINFCTLQYSDTVDGTLVYTITYTTKTALTLNGAAVDMGEALEGNGVHVKNSANIHHEFDGKEEDHKAKDDVRFKNMVEKNAAEYSANWPVTTPDGENVTRQIVKWTVKLDLKALPDLEAGDTITITDTLSDGLRFVDGDDYVGLGSVLVGDDNEEITSGGPVQDGQTLTWTYKTLTKKVYTLTYYTEVTGAAFDGQNTTDNGNGQSTAHGTVSNDATVGHDGVTVGKDSDTEDVETILMEKGSHLIQAAGSGQDDEYQDAYQIDYTIHVNRGSVDLLPDSAGKLTLVDTLPREARLIGQVTFYEGDSYQYGSTSNVRLPDGVASFSLGANAEGETILTCVLPDDQHIVIQYRMTPQNLRPGETVELTNTVEMTGTYQAQTSTTEKIRYFTGSATVTGAKGMLTVAKVDAQNNPLAGASFDLYRIDVTDANTGNYTLAGDPVRVEEEVTGNADGEVVLGRTGLKADTLYYFVENTAPEGYIKSTARHYFMLLSQRTADTARAEYVQGILTANSGDDRLTGLTADSVTFGRYDDGAELPVVNAVEETEVLLSAVKQFDGARENVPQVFQFELVDSNGKVLQEKTTTAQGEIAFDALTYDYNDLGKTFTYTIREVDGGSEDYVYDDTQFTAEVTLTWDAAAAEGQRLKATVAYKNGDRAVPEAVFNNYTAKTELQGVKRWNDGGDPARPKTVELTLHRYLAGAVRNPDQDLIVAAEPTWDKTDLNNWVWKYTGLDKYDQDGNELAYYVVETVPEGYAADYDEADNAITNTKTTDITVTKNWVDNNNAYNTRPEEITVQLLRTNGDGTESVGEPVLLNAENDWTNTWSALPAFDAAGKAYTYSVQEISAPKHYASTVEGLTITNTLSEKTGLAVNKVWVEAQDNAEIRPEAITVELLANGTQTKTAELNAENSWSAVFTDLEKYDADGKKIVYTVQEQAVNGYDSVVGAVTENADGNYSVTITNTLLTTDLTGAKNWVDSGNAYETRPETVTLTLYRAIENGEPEIVTGFTPVWENTETDTWTWKYSGMPKYDRQGKLYTYTVAEEPVPGYETAYGDNNAITNTLLTTDLTGAKNWVDSGNAYETRPETVTLTLYRAIENGEPEAVTGFTPVWENTETDTWTWKYSGMPKYDRQGNLYTYTVAEEPVPGYETAYGDNNAITNTLLTTDLTGAKNWVDSGNAYETRPETVTLTLCRAIENGEPEIVTGFTPVWENTETDTWTWKYSGMPKYDRQGKLYTYTVAEEPVPGYETAYGDSNAITNTLLTTELAGTKSWADDSNIHGNRPETVTLTLYRAIENGEPEIVTGFTPVWENTETDTWTWKYSGMPKYDRQGSLYTYTVEEEPVPGYETAYGENNAITNTLILTQATVTKNWVDGETGEPLDAEVLPDSIMVQLLQNGKPYEIGNLGEVTLTAEDNWTHTWTGLPKFDADGKPYTYTVVETDIPDGYTVRYGTAQPGEETPDAQAPAGAPEGENAEPAQTPAEDIALTVTNTLHRTEAAFTAKKVYYGVTDKAFTFELKAVTPPENGAYIERVDGEWDGASEIRDDGGNLPLVTASRNVDGETMTPQDIDFGATFVYTEPGIYYYTITEKPETATAAEGPQLVNDPSTYLVKVEVTAERVAEGAKEPGSTLQADVTYTWLYEDMEEDVDEKNVAFYNNEIMLMSLDGGFVEINGEKRLESDGQPLEIAAGQFRFNLYRYAEGSTAQDYLQGEPLATAAVDADGTFTFYYSITELQGTTTFAVVEQNAGQTIDGITHTDKVGVVTVSADGKVDNAGITGENAFVNQSAVSVSVEKVWEDNGLTITHQPVTVTLYADGEAKSTVKVAAGETYTWENLPARNPQGEKIVYTVGEAEVENYTAEITEIEGEATYSYRITNTLNAEGSITIDPTVDKRVEGREGTALTAGEFTFQLADENGEVLSEVTNDADGHVIFDTLFYDADDIGLHTYIIREVPGSDPHFDYDETEIRLSVEVTRDEENPTVLHAAMTYYDAEGETETPAFVNRYYPVILAVQKTSKDGSNDPLPGAVYGLWMVNESGGEDVYLGNQVADENGYMYFRDGVQIGSRYYFKEEFAPDGHTVDEYPSITFVVEKTESGFRLAYDSDNSRAKNAPAPAIEDGQISEDLQAVVLEFKNGAVGVQDEVTKLYVSKLDENTREPVTGAVLQIIEKSTGTVAYQWTSGTAAQAIERVLNVDTVYILREVTAPEGYDKAEDTEFSFDAYGNLTVHSGPDAEWVGDTTLNLYDTKRDVTITKQVTEEVVRRVDRVVHTVRSIPQTGDGAPIVLVASLSLCGILFIIYLQERKRANRRDK